MTGVTGKGSAMHMEFVPVRLEGRKGTEYKLGKEHIPEIRKLLRSSMTIEEIATHFHVSKPTMVGFIKRRQICDMKERGDFISLQRSLAREDQRSASK